MSLSSTEGINELTKNIDNLSSAEIVKLINDEDKKVAFAVERCLPQIAFATDIITNNFYKGGRLFYFGAGTSGRLGVLDASECPPTFGTPPELVQGIIAGGDTALRTAIEGAEDSETAAEEDFNNCNLTSDDTVVVISAGGNAKYILKILSLAKTRKIKCIAVTSNRNAEVNKFADIVICPVTGAEVIAGSTRMKAGTAQKMILNMLTTTSMIRLGKVYDNLMIDVNPTNEKLKKRAIDIVAKISGSDCEMASLTLVQNNYKVKQAVLTIKYNLSFEEASQLLFQNNYNLKTSMKNYEQKLN